nr:MAG TPA: hypothetical protein [Caudoviricetes sp.]
MKSPGKRPLARNVSPSGGRSFPALTEGEI